MTDDPDSDLEDPVAITLTSAVPGALALTSAISDAPDDGLVDLLREAAADPPPFQLRDSFARWVELLLLLHQVEDPPTLIA